MAVMTDQVLEPTPAVPDRPVGPDRTKFQVSSQHLDTAEINYWLQEFVPAPPPAISLDNVKTVDLQGESPAQVGEIHRVGCFGC